MPLLRLTPALALCEDAIVSASFDGNSVRIVAEDPETAALRHISAAIDDMTPEGRAFVTGRTPAEVDDTDDDEDEELEVEEWCRPGTIICLEEIATQFASTAEALTVTRGSDANGEWMELAVVLPGGAVLRARAEQPPEPEEEAE